MCIYLDVHFFTSLFVPQILTYLKQYKALPFSTVVRCCWQSLHDFILNNFNWLHAGLVFFLIQLKCSTQWSKGNLGHKQAHRQLPNMVTRISLIWKENRKAHFWKISSRLMLIQQLGACLTHGKFEFNSQYPKALEHFTRCGKNGKKLRNSKQFTQRGGQKIIQEGI